MKKNAFSFVRGLVLGAALYPALTVTVPPVSAQPPANAPSPAAPTILERLQKMQAQFRKRQAALPPQERKAWEQVQRMIRADFTLAFIGREVRQSQEGKETEQWIRTDPAIGVRIEGIRPDNYILLDTEHQSFAYDTRTKVWSRKASFRDKPTGRMVDSLRHLCSGELKATLEGQDKVAGRACSIVRVGPAEGVPGPSHRFWIDQTTGLRLKMEIVAPEGRILSTSYLLNVDLSPQFRPDDFTLPENVAPDTAQKKGRTFKTIEAALQAGVAVTRPNAIPTGYTLQKVEAFGPDTPKPRVTLRYSNGLSVISLTQFIASTVPPRLREMLLRNGPGFLPNPRGGGERAYLWQSGTGVYILISALSDEEVKHIAAGL